MMKKINILILFIIIIAQSAISQTATGVVTKVPCNNDGIYTVTATGFSLPITYTYYVNGTTVVHSNVNSLSDQLTNFGMSRYGNVSCSVTNGSSNAWTSKNYTPVFTFSFSAISPVCPATMGTVSATRLSGTTGPFTYKWTNKQTSISYSGNNATVPVGNYSVVIKDQTTGCVLEIADSATYVEQLSNVTGSISSTIASCTNGTAKAVASGGIAPYSYLWVNGATTSSINGLSQGYYTLIITDAQGCQSNNLGAYIQQTPFISVNTVVTNATCIQSDGSAIAFGSRGVNPYTYAWSDGQTGNTAKNLSGGTYPTVIATDANGCRGRGSAYINSNTPIKVTYTSTSSKCTSPTGSATLSYTGGTAPYKVVWNTSPSSSGKTLSNVSPGTYSFQVTDAVGCVRTGLAVVSPISSINVNVYASSAVCPSLNGTATAFVSGSNPPFTYLWSNGAKTSKITGLSSGRYSCVITDALSCTVTKSVFVKNTSPINVAVSTTPASCIFNTDGTATSIVSGGLPPYKYVYTNSTTTPNASGLGVGNYWLSVTDANGCRSSRHFWIKDSKASTSCYCTISGNVYLDTNANCIYETGESGIENIMMHCSGYGYTFTDANGYYSFQVPTGTYTISEQINAYYPLASCQSNSNSVSVVAKAGCKTVVDIANNIKIINDLKLVTVNSTLPPVPGYNYQQKVIVTNRGTVTEAGIQMEYEHDGQLPFANSTLSSFIQLNKTGAPYTYSVQSGFPTLKPNAKSVMLLNYKTPTNIPLKTRVTFYDTVAHKAPIGVNWLLDYTPWNNVNTYQTVVVGSYDPNYKEVSPLGEGPEGYISSETIEFDYTIHFQNEGTYFARNISVTDQLDDDLDWTTLKPGYSDFEYTTTVSETGLITFTFENINLPWKDAYGDALSSGLINYSIQRKSTTPKGTEFTNTANIYFDFNEPIKTNTTLNTLKDDPTVGEIEFEKSNGNVITADLYPVPAKDLITIRINNVSENETATISIIDIMGNVVMSEKLVLSEGSTVITRNISDLATGTYITLIQFDSGTVITKKLLMFQD